MKHKFKKQIDIIVIAVLLGLIYFGFKPLFSIVSDSAQVTIEALAAALGAILGAGFTWALLNRQSEVESSNKQKDRYFQEKVKIFSETIQNIETCINESLLNPPKDEDKLQENIETFKYQVRSFRPKLLLISDKEIQNSFEDIIQTIQNSSEDFFAQVKTHKDFIDDVQTSIERFAQICNVDMGMGGKELEEYKDIEEIEKESEVSNSEKEKEKEKNIIVLKQGEIELLRNTRFDYKNKKNLPKRLLAFLIIRDILEKEKSKINDLESFKSIIKQEWYAIPNKRVPTNAKIIETLDNALKIKENTGHKRFYMSDNDIINLGSDSVVITNQWGTNIKTFIDAIQKNYNELWHEIKISKT
jgi:hypothetical protein